MLKKSENQAKIVFKDGKEYRAIRGKITNEDDFFIHLKRRDGRIKIAKSVITKIEEWKNDISPTDDKKTLKTLSLIISLLLFFSSLICFWVSIFSSFKYGVIFSGIQIMGSFSVLTGYKWNIITTN